MDYEFSDDDIVKMYHIIGFNVKRLREKHNLSQLELSYKMGYKSVSLISSAELCTKGKHFNIEHLYKIATILNIEMFELLEDIKTT